MEKVVKSDFPFLLKNVSFVSKHDSKKYTFYDDELNLVFQAINFKGVWVTTLNFNNRKEKLGLEHETFSGVWAPLYSGRLVN